ncbi:MAG: hypothetical protein IPF94_01505 [Betaproteobacteria bacterium]|nr:hypothetical protein [Betaproteobacteria bacterium]
MLLVPWMLAASFTVRAADPDLGALDLKPELPDKVETSGRKLFVEAAAGRAEQRYGLGSRTIGRASIDYRDSTRLGPSTQANLSARVDATDPKTPGIDGAVLSLREAFVGWQNETATQLVDLGRINLRDGPGYGYNPTDFFRDQALRTVTTVNPFTLRENRLGTVMLRVQQLWPESSLSLVLAPKLRSVRSSEGFSADLGATNSRSRSSLALGNRWSEKLNTQVIAYKEDSASVRLGGSLTALVSQAAVVHAEVSRSSEPDLLSRALGLPATATSRNRLSAGLTYTTESRLSITAEAQYNGFALDRDQWLSQVQGNPQVQAAYYVTAQDLQDNAGRESWLLYAVQRDLGVKGLDLTVLLKVNSNDRSRMVWLDLRRRFDKADLALQFQDNSGVAGSEFGVIPIRRSAGLVATFYF